MLKRLLLLLTAITLVFTTVTSVTTVSTALAKETSSAFSGYTYEFSNLSTKTKWKIVFDKDFDKSTVNSDNITISKMDNTAQTITVTYNTTKKYIEVKPKIALEKNGEFLLTIKNLKDSNGDSLGTMTVHFTTNSSSSAKTQEVKFVGSTEDNGDIDQLREENKKLREENNQLKNRIKELEEEIERLEEELAKVGGGDQDNTPLTNEYFTIEYPKGFKDDAKKMYKYLEIAVASSKIEFNDMADVDRLLKQPKPLKLKIYDAPNDYADVGHWSIERKDDKSFIIHVLAPKSHYIRCCTNTGRAFDDLYFKTTMIHEYMTLPLRKVLEEKSRGWNGLYTAPEWFVQGIEEYYGYHYGEDMDSVNILIKRVKEDRSSIKFSSDGITVRDPYHQGTVLLFFMYETYGKDKVHSIIQSSEATWEKAFAKEIGTYTEVEKAFEKWLAKK